MNNVRVQSIYFIVLTFTMNEYEIIQTDLATQKFSHIYFVGVQGAKQYLQHTVNTLLHKIILKTYHD